MLLNYIVSEDDYLAFNIYHARRMPNYRRMVVSLCLLLPVLLVAAAPLAFLAFPAVPPWVWAGVAAVSGGLWVMLMPSRFEALIRRHIRKTAGERNDFIGRFSLELRAAGLIYTGNGEQREIAYERILTVTEDAGRIYLLLDAPGVILVPLAAFAAPDRKEAFLDLLRVRCPAAEFILPAPA